MVERKIIQDGMSAPLISKKKKRQGMITLGIIISIVLAITMFIIFTTGSKVQKIGDYTISKVVSGDLTTSTEASGSVVLPTQVSIVSMDAGYASELNVQVGESVTTSTILATIYLPDLEQDKMDLESELQTMNIDLEQEILSSEYTLKELNLDLTRLNEDILEANDDVIQAEKLKNLKTSRISDYEDAIEVLKGLNEDKEDILLSIEKETKQSALSIRSINTNIKQSQTELSRIVEDINDANIKSPISGTVLSIESKLTVPGSRISSGTELFTIANTEDVYIDLEVYEEYRTALEVGDKMEILVSSNIIQAEIMQIGSVASLSSDSLAATIEVRAKPIGDVNLTSGASAVADIPLGTKSGALLLPRGSYLTTGNQKYVYKVDGNLAIKTVVVYGAIDGNQVEVISGLEAGDKIIISSYQQFIDQESVELK